MKILILLLSLNLFPSGNSNKQYNLSSTQTKIAFDHNHQAWNEILKNYVVPGKISTLFKYKALKANVSLLNSYLKHLESVSDSDFQKFNKKQKLSFWINAYNAYTVKLIINHYPLKSIKDIKGEGGFLGVGASPWKIKFIKLLGKMLSLDNVEHDIIRKDFDEPRIHFAVNCASMGCPSLSNKAFSAKDLDKHLEDVSNAFINNLQKNKFDLKSKTFYASKIFKWYGSDFNKKFGSYKKFIKTLRPELSDLEQFKVIWNNYGWNLNESL